MKGILFLFLVFSICLFAQTTPQQSKQKLKEGNIRFQLDNLAKKNFQAEIEATSEGQNPHAIVVTCSDSRVTPEIIFDKSIGKIFVIRLAGNVIDTAAIGSIEYAVKFLDSSYLLVLGHKSCGAVGATVSGKDYSPSINAIAKMIAPAYQKVLDANIEEKLILDETIKENVHLQAEHLVNNSSIILDHVKDGSLKIGGAIYDITSGKVNFLKE